MSKHIWSIRFFIILWSSERSLGGGVVVIDWDVDVGCVWGEVRCGRLGLSFGCLGVRGCCRISFISLSYDGALWALSVSQFRV
jgi:hypothetical protein